MPVLEFLNSNVFSDVYQGDVPLINNEHINRICEELSYAIRAKEDIFVYGDYDMDGFCASKVWIEVFSLLQAKPPVLYKYTKRNHSLSPNIIDQVRMSNARVVIICDTGSSVDDRRVLNILQMDGYKTIVIDHHVYQGDYSLEASNRLTFNACEEITSLGNCEVSGAYASLLVAKVLCEKYMHSALSYNAKVYALASMYSDVVDMSSPFARALYNSVVNAEAHGAKGPQLFQCLNQWQYDIGRRLFSYIIVPKINGCFRAERFDLLNDSLQASDKYRVNDLGNMLIGTHDEVRRLTAAFVPQFARSRIGDIVLCVHNITEQTKALHIRNYTGVVAAKIAEEEMTAVVTMVKDLNHYEGSYRDYYNRKLLDTFSLFCEAGGHDSAFGFSFNDIEDFSHHIRFIGSKLSRTFEKPFITLDSATIDSADDYNVLALYNEYMNLKPMMVSHACHDVRLVRQTKYNKYYTVGLPGNPQVMTKRFLSDRDMILIEPCICKGVQLRERE